MPDPSSLCQQTIGQNAKKIDRAQWAVRMRGHVDPCTFP